MELYDVISKVQCRNEGYEKAFEFLVEEFKDRIFTVCYRMLSNYDDAREISQDTFVEVYLKIGNLKDPQKFPTWIYRITVNKCLNFLKKKNVSLPSNFDSFVFYEENLGIEKTDTIDFLLKQLTPEYRTVLILFYIEERSIKEITDIINISESAVKMRLKRARDKLKIFEER